MEAAASVLGCTPAALRLLIGVLLGYPLAVVYRWYVHKLVPNAQHIFFTVTGLALIIFNYRWDSLHSLTNIVVVYVFMRMAGRTLAGLAATFIFSLGYLLMGYLFTATDNYDIKWTMPHCILCLRLIGVAFDYYDGGAKDLSKLPPDLQATALDKVPSPLEMLGHSYYFGGCMVGPQFSMRRYQDFVQGTLWPSQKTEIANSVSYSMSRLIMGLIMMAFYQIGAIYVNDKVILSEEYLTQWSWCARWLFLGLFGTITLHKYVACWLMAEGSCALSGLSYNGRNAHGINQWNGLQNIWVWRFEMTTNFDGFIRAFNINTNKWVAQYIYKRLKFLGNKNVSHIVALGFLALWHGFHMGYYICFLNEFLVMKFERDVSQIIDSFPRVRNVVYHEKLQWLRLIFMKIYVASLFGYCLVPFILLKPYKFHQVYASFYYVPSILLAIWFFSSFQAMPLVKRMARDSSNGLVNRDASIGNGGKIGSDDTKAQDKQD
ncbi:lysophospholipid acyltransferase 5-like [Varroa jacobsoni]|uniref:Lysophospholipid acyltransferase 5 n=1 Tax=Varroa destructor TaxID=109461 RepID=A0A7M7KP41_VARDE|nr:lysophospholipid acyltransferase 5-like isoform X2 [Varroa destructor]XP_022689708.1 lysophospholipid acyltransferase 5-like [Varroa jacobsoni]XP_022689709.1 lysophospholipid acyltransferase 5-like [Varroa jacobsoni]XP_022689710.1 lysophospholipid acyltransferase 5-like [Varroa jacobsoni]XP_022689711.1 lysophospholipid acyltransferase 5-like [Varroa jacobsoni]XP_022689712.1 lysophospholipid acyltransferase 5-like [Varroa jacobsoni]